MKGLTGKIALVTGGLGVGADGVGLGGTILNWSSGTPSGCTSELRQMLPELVI